MNAESLVAEFESIAGEPWAQAAAAVVSAIDADLAAADAVLFVSAAELVMGADTIAQYTLLTDRIPAAGYRAGCAELHRHAHPALAALLRSHECIEDIGAAAARYAVPADRETSAAAGARAATRAIAEYKRAIASQLAEVPRHELAKAARAYLAAVALRERFEVARQRHEESARAELERVEAERKAAARAESAVAVERVRAAEAAAADARAKAALAEREYRALRAEALAERLRASGLKALRVGSGDGRELYSVDELITGASTNRYSLETLDRFDAALAAHEAAR